MNYNMHDISGWINIDKPLGMNSTTVVGIIKKALGKKVKVGHAGTLDPLATGVLPIAIGEATKTVSFIQDSSKEYEFDLKFGFSTETGDLEGKILEQSPHLPREEEIRLAIKEFIGDIMQTPPIYSAIKVDGQRSYKLARSGHIPEIQERKVTIYSLDLLSYDAKTSTASFKVTCSKGTYIRSLGPDIAKKLLTYGHICSLRRTRVGAFDKKNIISLEKCKELAYTAALKTSLLSMSDVLDDIPAIDFLEADVRKLLNGVKVKIPDNGIEYCSSKNVLAKFHDTLLGIGKVDNMHFCPTRIFNFNKGGYDVVK